MPHPLLALAGADDRADDEESALIARARSGDGRAFSQLVAPHLGMLYRVAARAARSPALAEDAVQETLELLHRRLERFQAGTSFKAFAAGIAVRRARTLLRAEARRSQREAASFAGEEPPTPAELAVEQELARRVRDVLAGLPEKRQRVALLRLDAGLGYREIAEAVGTTEGSARVLVHHVVRELEEKLADLLDGRTSDVAGT